MTPKEKKEELIKKFQKEIPDYLYQGKTLDMAAKDCAIICVDEIIDSIREVNNYVLTGLIDYWQQVKNELLK